MRRLLLLLALLASPVAAGTVPVVVSTNGTANALPKFTLAGATLGVSRIYDDGTTAGIIGGDSSYVKIGSDTKSIRLKTAGGSEQSITARDSDLMFGAGWLYAQSSGILAAGISSPAGGIGLTWNGYGVNAYGTTWLKWRFRAQNLGLPLVADGVVQVGQTVMPSATTDGRFVVNTGGAAGPIGVYDSTAQSAVGTSCTTSTPCMVLTAGVAYVCPSSGTSVTRGHYLCQSATAGVADDSATVCADGMNIGRAIYSEATDVLVSATATSDEIVLTSAPGWDVGDPVVYYEAGGAAIAGLTSGSVYFIKTISSATVTLCATAGCGTAVDITADGVITTQYLIRLPKAVLRIY